MRIQMLAFMGESVLSGFFLRRIKPSGKPHARRSFGDRPSHSNCLRANDLATFTGPGNKALRRPLALPGDTDVATSQRLDSGIDAI
jgi:hypothetical protein